MYSDSIQTPYVYLPWLVNVSYTPRCMTTSDDVNMIRNPHVYDR